MGNFYSSRLCYIIRTTPMQLPARIGKYELEEFLGGGMSHVYRSRDTVIGRTVAVKVLTEQGCQDAEVKARFLAEARMAGSLSHDNVLSIYDFGEDEQNRPFMVMEFLRGEDLRGAIKNGHTGDIGNKLKIAMQIARALGYIHTQKIVHRDIKPENIHINTAGVVKLMDFGIAKTEGLQMTRAGFVLGTPFYMAPEQVMGEAITEQVDVYAFGVLLFEIFTGVKPIQADTVERIFYFILNEPLNLEPLHASGAPRAICELVEQCTAKKPQARPQGFAPVVAALEQAIAREASPKRDEATLVLPPPVKPRPAWVLPAVLVVVAGLAAGLYFATRSKPAALPPTPPTPARTLALPSGDMVLVPGGPFQAGASKASITLGPYYIDKTEVTNRAYAEFCALNSVPLPAGFPKDKLDYPVVNITIAEARAFAKAAGKRLPKGLEWEKAARGPDGRMYPWGSEADAARANVGGKALQPVTAFPDGASPYGVLQMVGNVWEYVDEEAPASTDAGAMELFKKVLSIAPNQKWHATRGLSFHNDVLEGAALYDIARGPDLWKSDDIGFRCVKDAP